MLKHALAAELDTSCGGRGGKLVVPARWKWKLLHEVNELETAFHHTHGSSRGAGQQHTREPFSYRLWLMVHTGLHHVTHADTLLELQLVIHNSGATLLCLIGIGMFECLPTHPSAFAGVANVRPAFAAYLPLLPAVCFSSVCSCLSGVWSQSQCSCVVANFLPQSSCPGTKQALGGLRRLRSDTTSETEVQQIVRVCAERQYVCHKYHAICYPHSPSFMWCVLLCSELAQLASLPLQEWLAAAVQAEIDKIMDAKGAVMNES